MNYFHSLAATLCPEPHRSLLRPRPQSTAADRKGGVGRAGAGAAPLHRQPDERGSRKLKPDRRLDS